jgi:prepilin-type N-terminal cleavage/methylation domain-containing protein
MRRGFSLVELTLVLALVGTMMALATPRLWA